MLGRGGGKEKADEAIVTLQLLDDLTREFEHGASVLHPAL